MYLCRICGEPQGPGTPMLKHIVYRRNGQIAQEIPICSDCLEQVRKKAASAPPAPYINKSVLVQDADTVARNAPTILSEARKLYDTSAPKLKDGQLRYKAEEMTRGGKTVGRILPPQKNPGNGSNHHSTPRCDVCGADASDGQRTGHTILCTEHAKRARK